MLLFLPHHDVHRRVLVGEDLARLVEVDRASLPATARERRGFWVDPGGQRVVLAATPEGPVVLVGGRTLRFADVTVAIERREEDDRVCTLSMGAQIVAVVPYTVPPATGGWWEADEGFTDFFVWLHDNASNDDFVACYSEPG